MRFVPKYLQALGAAPFIIGLYDAIKTLLGAIYAWPGGVVADRFGHRRALVAFNVVSIIGYAVVLLVPHWGAVLAGTFLFLAWSCFSLPATFSLIGAALHEQKHAMGIGVQSVIKRLPIIVGPICGGVLIDRFGIVPGVRIALAITIVLGIATIFLSAASGRRRARRRSRVSVFGELCVTSLPRYADYCSSDILIRFCERIPYAWVVIYAMDELGMTAMQIGVLLPSRLLRACSASSRPRIWPKIRPRAVRHRDFRLLHRVSARVARSARLRLADGRVRHARSERVRRTCPESANHLPCAGGGARPHDRRILFDPRSDCDFWRVYRRWALEDRPICEFRERSGDKSV